MPQAPASPRCSAILATQHKYRIPLAQARKDPAVERRVRLWMADCAAHALLLFYKISPADIRPAQAIEAARAVAGAAARAVAGAAAGAAAWDAEQGWQFDRLVLWFSEDEPEMLPLPEPGA